MENPKSSGGAWVKTSTGEYVPFEVPEERRGKRPKYLTKPVNIRVPPDVYNYLVLVADFERCRKISELLRGWIRDKISSYERNPSFKHYLKRNIVVRSSETAEKLEP